MPLCLMGAKTATLRRRADDRQIDGILATGRLYSTNLRTWYDVRWQWDGKHNHLSVRSMQVAFIIVYMALSHSCLARPLLRFSFIAKTASASKPTNRRTGLSALCTPSTSTMDYKRAKLDDTVSEKVIGTHSGTFQADEAMGVWMLRQIPMFRNSRVVRSRDPKVLESQASIIIDVLGVYDHAKMRYDHHQRDYDERFDSGKEGTDGRCTKLSASGLVYRHYGKDVILAYYPTLSAENLDLVFKKVYDTLLEALDAIDTGVEMAPKGVELLYKDATGLSSRVSRLNPRWNEVDSNGNPPDSDERFERASQMCGEDFLSVLTKIVESDLPARDFVEKAVLERALTDPSGEIIKLTSGGLPWRNYLYEFEKKYSVDPLIKFVLYTDQSGMWRVQAVTVEGKAFENRLGLPEEWRGVRDADLEAVTKIAESRFVHAAGFIGGNDTYEGALKMAQVALTKK